MLDIISVPLMDRIVYASESANIFKLAVSGYDGSLFYLNQMDIMLGFSQAQKETFSPTFTS